jgi:putative endonuclease
MDNRSLGQLGENMAGEFLAGHGWTIVARNFFTRYGEIDLIAQKKDLPAQAGEILFVEVKTRSSVRYGYPEQAVDRAKVKRLLRAISIYRQTHGLRCPWRIDIISVELNHQTRLADIHWFKDITSY